MDDREQMRLVELNRLEGLQYYNVKNKPVRNSYNYEKERTGGLSIFFSLAFVIALSALGFSCIGNGVSHVNKQKADAYKNYKTSKFDQKRAVPIMVCPSGNAILYENPDGVEYASVNGVVKKFPYHTTSAYFCGSGE